MIQAIADSLAAAALGLPLTLAIWLAGVGTGLAAGFVIGAVRFFAPAALTWPLATAVEAVRGTPFLVQCFLLYFGGPFIGIDLSPILAGWVALSVYGAAYFSEVFRAGFMAVPPGQLEAARLLGLSRPQAVLRIMLPMMALAVLPSLVNLAVILIKETAVLSIITVPELTFRVQGVGSATFAFAETTLVLALVYWALVEATAWASRHAERRIARALAA
ncbi:amino acid ABC transporter permease [Falsiroseomonas selenitidurans]|uniref:Amino acid ABC transporter permease n=1 Tax=Falsiroseomonas selenitidurans TaxID=2716335 RepID=A0ABX1E6Y2_9PROT|nr:amino acid ABC transporter permease [Falsiroseomonas selenitidurans]NKC32831.1 amino acid ABC transporter permease [Falsiroseomonas selenitidurans]